MAFDSREFRDTLGRFATGVTVVTTGDAPNFVGMTAQSFSSLSLDPPLVLVCVDKGASVLPLLKESATFTVNVLADSDMELSNFFASSSRPAPPHQFDDTPYTVGATGQPAAGVRDDRVRLPRPRGAGRRRPRDHRGSGGGDRPAERRFTDHLLRWRLSLARADRLVLGRGATGTRWRPDGRS